jgi:pyruvate dehydrogenase E2 component (dihydrolipoamide acetyltransferase)
MSLTVIMPQLGLTMTEGTISRWLKKPGDTIKKDEPIFIVSTDKADMEVESMVEGTLSQIIVNPGQTVPVGTVLGYVEGPGEDRSAAIPAQSTTMPAWDSATTPPAGVIAEEPRARGEIGETETASAALESEGSRKGATASPRARRLAKQLGLDLSKVKSSGPGGRIIEEDVRNAAAAMATPIPVEGTSPNARRRQLIAERMVESVRTIPHFSVSLEVNAEKLVALYESLKELVEPAAGSKLTYTDLLLKALALALTNSPEMNATWEEGAIRRRTEIDLGLAIATEHGVAAPVLRGVDRLPLGQIVVRRAELAEKARQSRLALSDLEGGVGTLSNLGMYRVDRFQAIINPGQSFIVAVGKVRNRPWVDTALVIKPTIVFNVSVDHRVADGTMAAIFLERIAEVVENPYRILWSAETK